MTVFPQAVRPFAGIFRVLPPVFGFCRPGQGGETAPFEKPFSQTALRRTFFVPRGRRSVNPNGNG